MLSLSLILSVALAADGAPEKSGPRVESSVIYSSPAGEKLRAQIYRPKAVSAAPRPAVVLIHGGAWLFGTRHQLHWYGHRLAENGYVAMSIQYRMMPDHPFPACAHDAKAAVCWLRSHAAEYGVDPDRIGVLGNSAGGQLAGLLATTIPEDGLEGEENAGVPSAVRAAVSLYGVSDLTYYRNPTGWVRLFGFTRSFLQKFVGEKGVGGRDPYEAASPITYARPTTCPILLVHGKHDGQVPCWESEIFRNKLERLGVPTRLILVKHGHAFDFFYPRERKKVFVDILAFLNTYLKDAPPASS